MPNRPVRTFRSTIHNPGPPKSLSWDAYRDRVSSAWAELLDSDPEEAAVHDFLERHPCLLPEAYGLYSSGHHGVLDGAFVSRPELPGMRLLVPDFMYMALDSANVTVVLIEIERPGKAHSNKNGTASRDLRQARSQLSDWRTWFDDPVNVTRFQKDYGVSPAFLKTRGFKVEFVLVFGRRHDLEGNVRFSKTRGHELGHTEMTFDRLAPSERNAGVPVGRLDRTNAGEVRLRIVAVSPMASEFAFSYLDPTRVTGVKEALADQPDLSAERRQFLLECALRPPRS